jgi:hypothetical protein
MRYTRKRETWVSEVLRIGVHLHHGGGAVEVTFSHPGAGRPQRDDKAFSQRIRIELILLSASQYVLDLAHGGPEHGLALVARRLGVPFGHQFDEGLLKGLLRRRSKDRKPQILVFDVADCAGRDLFRIRSRIESAVALVGVERDLS